MLGTAEVAADMRACGAWLGATTRGGNAAGRGYLEDLAADVESAAPAAAEARLRAAAAHFGEGRQTAHAAMLRDWLEKWADALSLPCGGKGPWATWRSRRGLRTGA